MVMGFGGKVEEKRDTLRSRISLSLASTSFV